MGKSYAQLGRYQEALDALHRAPKPQGMYPPVILGDLGYVYARKGDGVAAHAALRQLRAMDDKIFVDPYFPANFQLFLVETNSRLTSLTQPPCEPSSIPL